MAGGKIINLGGAARALGQRMVQSLYSSAYGTEPALIRDIPANAWPNPLQPIPAFGPKDSEPLTWNFWEGQNLNYTPRSDALYTADELRALSMYPLARMCIENVKDIVCQTEWQIGLKPLPGETHSQRAARAKGDENIVKLTEFFEHPDGRTDWASWSRVLLENMLVIDAGAVLVERSKRGKVSGLEVIKDGGSLTTYIDERGRTPDPPSIAYSLNWWGLPRTEHSTDEILYGVRNIVPRNTLSSYMYGLSPVESIAEEIKIGIERLNFTLAYYCYSDDTEVFTKRGWLRFEDVSMQDEFATRQINAGLFEWQKPTELFRKYYDGEMVHFTGQSTDILVTPNHRMLVSKLPRKLKRKRTFREREHVVAAEDLLASRGTTTPIVTSCKWAGKEIGDVQFESHDPRSKPVLMSGDDFCAFMGMYVAEGSLKGRIISISQPKDVRGSWKLYGELLNSLFGNVYHDERQFEFSRRALADFLRQFGHAEEKFIPEEILSTTPRQMAIFWKYYCAGDGAQNKGQRKCNQVFTVSKRLSADVCELTQKMGLSLTTWLRPAGFAKVGDRVVRARDGYMLTARKTPVSGGNTNWKARRIDYRGYVCCVTVPNSFLLVRRNGKVAWSGNTAGSVPDVIQIAPPGIPPDKVKETMQANNAALSGQLNQRRKWTILQGFQTDGKLDQILFPKEPLLADPFDEMHIRKVCYALGDAPQRLLKTMNRSSSESSQTAAEEEGIMPWVIWLSNLINRIIKFYMRMPQYEISFKMIRESDIIKLMQADVGYVKNGMYTTNERRELRGDDPRPEPQANELGIITANGWLPIGQTLQPSPGMGKTIPSSRKMRLIPRGETAFGD